MRGLIGGFGLAVVAVAAAAGSGFAQRPHPVDSLVGQRVRVRQCDDRGCSRVAGVLLASGPDTLRLGIAADSAVPVPRATVRRIEQSLGRHSRPVPGMLIGAGIGLGAGLLTGAVLGGSFECGYDIDCGELVALTSAAGVLAGGIVGLAVGAMVHTETWSRVPVERLTAAPMTGRWRIGLALRVPY